VARDLGRGGDGRVSWSRARSTPTSSSPARDTREHQEPPQRRRPARDLSFDLIEPLRSLFKDEVRHVGEELGLPPRSYGASRSRPRLGVRIIGEVTANAPRYCATPTTWWSTRSRRPASTANSGRASRAAGRAHRGVMATDDLRLPDHHPRRHQRRRDDRRLGRLPYDVIESIANRLIREVEGVNRVALDVTSKPPGTIEWE